MTASATAIKKVIEKHLEELGFLWRQRAAALRSPNWRPPDVKWLDGRIEPHLDALRIAARADAGAVAACLKSEDPWAAVAAGVALLQLQLLEAARAVVEALLAAEPKQADAIRRALLHGPIDLIEDPLRAAADSALPHVAAAALEALLYHGRKNVNTNRLPELVRHEDPAIRCTAWRIMALSEGP
jgi:hypothetical protein